jgi:hypothetical protein
MLNLESLDQIIQAHPTFLEHTPGHINCPACRATRPQVQLEKVDLSVLIFTEASHHWREIREQDPRLKPATRENINWQLQALDKFFGKLRLNEITPGHLRAYQIARQANSIQVKGGEQHPWLKAAGPSCINHELGTLAQMLKHCRLWDDLKPFYFPLVIQGWTPRQIPSVDDEREFFEKASRAPEAGLAFWVALITANTTASGCELRGLRMENISLDGEIPEIIINEESVKNNYRPRPIPLNPTARWAVAQCYKRALKLGCCDPTHYLFPLRLNREGGACGTKYDPTRPAGRTFLRKSWVKLREVTGNATITPHDLRFLCITRLYEKGTDPEKVRALSGHISQKMSEHYSLVRRETKYEAVMRIEPAWNMPAR